MRADAAASGPGLLLSLIAEGRARARAELAAATGFSRTTVTQHLAQLLAAGLITEDGEARPQSTGRPSRLLRLAPGAACVLAADIGETHMRLGITDLEPRLLAERILPVDLAAGPIAVLGALAQGFRALLAECGATPPLLGIGLGLPAPVDHVDGRVVGPSVMPGWDDFDICDCLSAHLGAPVLVENDVNLLTLAESAASELGGLPLLYVKAGTGLGSGIMAEGRLYRGAQGASGDIGHILIDEAGPACRCGKRGCLDAYAAGWALARDLRAAGRAATTARDVIALHEAGVPEAEAALAAAGRVLGRVIASTVSILNPGAILVGGSLARAGETLLSGIRAEVHARNLPLAIRHLRILRAAGGPEAGLIGAARLVIAERLAPAQVDHALAALTPSSSPKIRPLRKGRLRAV